MVKKIITLALALVLPMAIFLLTPLTCRADNGPKPSLVVDMAELYTGGETAELSKEAKTLSEAHEMDIVIVTTEDAGGKTSREYADDYFDDNGYGVGAERDGILFLIDMDNREAYISTSGNAIRYLTDARLNHILDAVYDSGLTKGDMYAAAQTFLSSTEEYLNAGIPAGQTNVEELEKNSLTLWEALAGLIIAIIAGLGYNRLVKKSYQAKYQTNTFDYRGNSRVSLGTAADNLVNSYVTSRVIVKSSSSSGGGNQSTVHHSSSGRSHGGGGRKF